jgi:hypothetical protein
MMIDGTGWPNWRGCGRFRRCLGVVFRRLEIGTGAAALHRRRHAGADQRRPRAFDAHDPDIALAEFGDQVVQLQFGDVDILEVEHHRTTEEEAGGASREVVQPRQPALHRQFRRQRQRHERAPLEADRTGLCYRFGHLG